MVAPAYVLLIPGADTLKRLRMPPMVSCQRTSPLVTCSQPRAHVRTRRPGEKVVGTATVGCLAAPVSSKGPAGLTSTPHTAAVKDCPQAAMKKGSSTRTAAVESKRRSPYAPAATHRGRDPQGQARAATAADGRGASARAPCPQMATCPSSEIPTATATTPCPLTSNSATALLMSAARLSAWAAAALHNRAAAKAAQATAGRHAGERCGPREPLVRRRRQL